MFDHRQNCFIHKVGSYWPDPFETDHTILVDQVSLRYTVDSVIDTCASIRIQHAQHIWTTKLNQCPERIFTPVLVIQSDDGDRSRARELGKHGMLFPTCDAPGCPGIE